MATQVAKENLSTWLSSQPTNSADTAYEIEVTGLTATDSDIINLRSALINNSAKYVDLSYTTLPAGLTDLSVAFFSCYSLVKTPIIPEGVYNLHGTFENCINLLEASDIPSSASRIDNLFSGCYSLSVVKQKKLNFTPNMTNGAFGGCISPIKFYTDEPYELKNWFDTANIGNHVDVSDCTFRLYSSPVTFVEIPITKFANELGALSSSGLDGVYKIKITGLTTNVQGQTVLDIRAILLNNTSKFVDLSDTITPEGETSFEGAFKNCSNLYGAPSIPDTVTNMKECFYGCTLLTVIRHIPLNVTNLTRAFYNCSYLSEISDFRVPLDVLKTNAENCFFRNISYASLKIKVPKPIVTPATEWHVMSLKFTKTNNEDYISGKIYSRNGTSVSIPQTKITKTDLQLPVLTDELMFTDSYTDQELEAIILKSIQYGYSYWNKTVLDVTRKNFVFWADDVDNFKTNLPIKPVNVVEENNMSPVTSNAVFNALSSVFTIKRLKDADCSTVGTTYSLDTGEKFSDWDFIIPIVSTYDSSEKVFEIIPKAEIEYAMTQSGNSKFTHIGTVSGTTRRMSWSPKSDTTFTIGHRDGTSSHLPHLWGFYGVKFG